MGFERIAELKIREAINEGKFDDLPNVGKAIDLEGYFELPADRRLAYSILKNADCLPQEVELLNEIARLERSLVRRNSRTQPADEVRLRDCRLRLAILLEKSRRSQRFDSVRL